jgi:hypothetical protein
MWEERREIKRTSPTLLGIINKVHDVEGIGVLLPELVQLVAEEDILLGDVGEEKCELGLVRFVRESMGYDLVERRADKDRFD